MKSLKDIHNIISQYTIKPRQEMRKKVLDQAMENYKDLKPQSTARPLDILRLLISSRVTQITAVAVIMLLFIFNTKQENQQQINSQNGNNVVTANLFGELQQIRRMTAASDIYGLLKMVSGGQLESKLVAARALNNILDTSALEQLAMHASGDIIIDRQTDNLRLSSTGADQWLEVKNGSFVVHKDNNIHTAQYVRLTHDSSGDPNHWSELQHISETIREEKASLEEKLSSNNNEEAVVINELKERLIKLNDIADSIEQSINLTIDENGRLLLHAPSRDRKAYVEKHQDIVRVEAHGHIVESDSVTLLPNLNPVLTDGPPIPEEGWKSRFDRAYSLNDREVLRWVRSPYIPERQIYATQVLHYYASDNPPPPGHLYFRWNDTLYNWALSMSECSLGFVLRNIGLKTYQIDGPEELRRLILGGDFIARDNVTIEKKLSALEAILQNQLGRKITFDKKSVKRKSVVVSGQYQRTKLRNVKKPNRIYIYPDAWEDFSGPEPIDGGGHGSLVKMIESVGERFNRTIVIETENLNDISVDYVFSQSCSLAVANAKNEKEKQATLDSVLKNLFKQTGLQFDHSRHNVDVWFINEE